LAIVLPKFIEHEGIDDKDDWTDLVLPLGIKEHLNNRIISAYKQTGKPKDCGIILFGPPGTGKTTIPRSIAKELKWKLYDINPKIFVAEKDFSTEAKIRQCFEDIKVLYEKNGRATSKKLKSVFMFDEIDELVVSRDGGADKQSRLLTTMMLPLFNDLRKAAAKHDFVFFVMTNHIERFDPAIKRTGRFDSIIPLGPPERPARYVHFEKVLHEMITKHAINDNLQIQYFITDKQHKVTEYLVDLDIISRAAERLGFGDINGICEKVIEQAILSLPHSLETIRNYREKYPINIYTSQFIEWINKYRNSNTDIQKEIDRYYQEYAIYSRGSSPYVELNNIQEKAHHELSSLLLRYNRNDLINRSQSNPIPVEIYLLNLTDMNTFYIENYTIQSSGAGTKKQKFFFNCTQNNLIFPVQPGRPSEPLANIIPTKTGTLHVEISISGYFDITGIDLPHLEGHNSSLKATINQILNITIK